MRASRAGRLTIVAGPTSFEIVAHRLAQPTGPWTSLSHHTSYGFANRFSPDGPTIVGPATDNIGENAYLVPLAGGPPRQVTAQPALIDHPYWSADGRHLAYEVFGTNSSRIGTMFTDADAGSERRIHYASDAGALTGWFGNDAVVLTRGSARSIHSSMPHRSEACRALSMLSAPGARRHWHCRLPPRAPAAPMR